MTEKERTERLARAQAQQDAIRRARETAQLARSLWPRDAEDELHGKVEILVWRLRSAGQDDVARQVAHCAHNAAWRKHKHAHHISDVGDVEKTKWWADAVNLELIVEAAKFLSNQTRALAARPDDTVVTHRLIDAAYWTVADLQTAAQDAQDAIPCVHDSRVSHLHQQMDEWLEDMQQAKDALVALAARRGHTITR